jgi:DHA3 family tetracycline resistance protein-like MFS transporter
MPVYRLDAFKVYLLMGGLASLAFSMIFTALGVYYVQTVGMNPLQLVLVGTTVEATILLFEVPTGVVADTYSRRLSVIIGFALIGLCYIMQGFLPLFAAIILAEFVRGVGETFTSGAADAWIADEIGEGQVGRAYLRAGQVSRITGFAGIGLGTGLAVYQLQLPVVIGGVLLVLLSLLLALVMPERGFHPTAHGQLTPWATLAGTARTGFQVVRGRPVVLMLLTVGVVFGAFSEGFDRLWEAHFLRTLSFPVWPSLPPVVWIGLINAGGMVIGLVAAEALIRRIDMADSRRLHTLLFAISAGLVVSVITFGLAPGFGLGLAAYWTAGVLRSLQHPLASTWLNQHLPSRVRATVLSIYGQSDALGQLAGGPVVGVVGLRSLRAALVFSGVILTPALLLYGRGLPMAEVEQPAPVVGSGE